MLRFAIRAFNRVRRGLDTANQSPRRAGSHGDAVAADGGARDRVCVEVACPWNPVVLAKEPAQRPLASACSGSGGIPV
jgi:hypothetical protein